jgi:RNA polymerase sigma-70 factor (ECF subfamily)
VTAELIARARSGDGAAFGELVEAYRQELQVHCYRILGSLQDAEDALQETLISAWQGFAGFEERASIRTWLYRIATSRCLDALRHARRRLPVGAPRLDMHPPEPTRLGEAIWLEPYPDALLAVPDPQPGPEARYEARESISLAFVTALQQLPPRPRAVLILRDVLGFHAKEVADMLDTTEESVTSALKRARAALPKSRAQPPPPPGSAIERRLVAQLTSAFENGDLDGIVALLTDDAWVTMPPSPLQYQGPTAAARFFAAVSFREGRRYDIVPTRANGQPAMAAYVRGPGLGMGVLVFTLAGDRVSAVTRFDSAVLPSFSLPLTRPPRF